MDKEQIRKAWSDVVAVCREHPAVTACVASFVLGFVFGLIV